MNKLDPLGWLKENSQYFSTELNGYSDVPIVAYLTTLPLIDRGGKVLDLGSGNGMLLKFVMQFSRKSIIPFGVELNHEANQQAKETILPEFSTNFIETDVNNYDFSNGPFDIIITNPFYGKPTMTEYIDKCFSNLNAGGMILLRLHSDVLIRNNIEGIEQTELANKYKIRSSSGGKIEYGVIEK